VPFFVAIIAVCSQAFYPGLNLGDFHFWVVASIAFGRPPNADRQPSAVELFGMIPNPLPLHRPFTFKKGVKT